MNELSSITQVGGTITGNGSGLTNLNATNLASGTVPAARMPALTGDVTTSAGAVAATIATNAVTDAKFRQSAGLSVVGNATNSGGNVSDITAASDGQVLRRNGTAVGFGQVNLASSNAVTGTLSTGNLPLATAANMEALSGATVVAPNVQAKHPGHPKAWGYFTVSGTTPSIAASYGVSGIVYAGSTGAYTITWSTAFSSSSYCVQITSGHKGGTGNLTGNVNGLSTTQLGVLFTAGAGTLADPVSFYVVAFGDQ